MKIIKQLLRQPIKTLSGLLLMTLAVSILCVTVGQALAAKTTREELERRFSSVAIPTIQENSKGAASAAGATVEAELLAWLEEMSVTYPDIIKTVARHGTLSAYIPQMTPYNVTTDQYIVENITDWAHNEYYQFQSDPYAQPYSCAMLVITLEEVGEIIGNEIVYDVNNDINSTDFVNQNQYEQWLGGDPKPETVTAAISYQVEITGTVTDVISLAEGYRNPVGRVARLTYTASTLEEIEALNLEPGAQYIVYGMDYFDECTGLLQKKDAELRRILDANSIPCTDRTKNPVMRAAIWQHYSDDLRLDAIDVDVTKGDTKSIWDKLQKYLPLYSLFQADRKNSDGDSEVQDPLKEAVKAILQDETLRQKLDEVAASVVDKLQDVSARTLAKLQEMSPDVASTLTPVIPPAESLKWADVFKSVSIAGDESIPINKRGSGTKRLILMNFFRAEVERRQAETSNSCVIYAIEEPETSQHYGNQRKLIHALQSLAQAPNTQIIITTHSATIVKELGFSNIRIIRMDHAQKVVEHTLPSQLPYPSLNEVNYLAFGEVSEEYHNELYGYLEAQNLFNAYKQGKPLVPYTRVQRNGNTVQEHITLTEYIRHQIHHPENTYNTRFAEQDLEASIIAMRTFIQLQP